MKYLVIPITALFIALTFEQCSYKLVNAERDDDKYAKEEESQYKWLTKAMFNGVRIESYEKYNGNITTDTFKDLTFIQFDSVRIYLDSGSAKFSSIFSSGLVTTQMFYCKWNKECTPPEDEIIGQGKRNFYGWEGNAIIITNMVLLKQVNSKATQRRFELLPRALIHTFSFGKSFYFLELTNENANSKTDIETFIKGARVTLFRYGWMEI